MPSALPEPFDCPHCDSNNVVVNADILISLHQMSLPPKTAWSLADNAKWHCLSCNSDGELETAGPVPRSANEVDEQDHQTHRYFRRIALDLLPLLNSRGLLDATLDVWEAKIERASLPILLGIILTLQAKLNLPEPEYEDEPAPGM